ncbi:MAG: NADH-quinone oxidoreductase subunit A [Colwellia sp.]|nr:NADH-quinone oxidoreductase subunit A [Colwellia sp.]
MSSQIAELWPIVAFFIILVIMLVVMMILSYVIGPKTQTRAKHIPYESGVVAVDANLETSNNSSRPDNHSRFTNHFFLYAIFFVIFDLETIFLFSWVIAFDEVGWMGFIEATIFIIILFVALIYLWRIGALELKHRHLPFKEQYKSSVHQQSSRGN